MALNLAFHPPVTFALLGLDSKELSSKKNTSGISGGDEEPPSKKQKTDEDKGKDKTKDKSGKNEKKSLTKRLHEAKKNKSQCTQHPPAPEHQEHRRLWDRGK